MGLLSLCVPTASDAEEELARLRVKVEELESENASLREDKFRLQQRLGSAVLGNHNRRPSKEKYGSSKPAHGGTSILGLAGAAPPADDDSPPGSARHDPSKDSIKKERRLSLGEMPVVMRADHVASGVLPLAAAFDRFDRDKSGGISLQELRPALEYLGVQESEAAAACILKQYDRYPDAMLDVKEFASLVRDVKLMIAFDENGDGCLDADELIAALDSLGLKVDVDEIKRIIERFDVRRRPSPRRHRHRPPLCPLGSRPLVTPTLLPSTCVPLRRLALSSSPRACNALAPPVAYFVVCCALACDVCCGLSFRLSVPFGGAQVDSSGTIDLLELSSLVRTAQAFVRYDRDGSGAIDIDEMRDALRKLGVKAGALEEAQLVRSPPPLATACASRAHAH